VPPGADAPLTLHLVALAPGREADPESGMLVSAGAVAFAELGPNSHCIIDKDDVRCEAHHLRTSHKGVGLVGSPFVMTGDFPLSAWMANVGGAGGYGGRADWIYRWRGDRWEEPKDNIVTRCLGIARWSLGRTLALVDPRPQKQGDPAMHFRVLDGPANGELPELPDRGKDYYRWSFTALPSGEIFVLGTSDTPPVVHADRASSVDAGRGGGPASDNVVLERWAPAASKPVVSRIPGLHSSLRELEKVN
jgi:hypothetical protein